MQRYLWTLTDTRWKLPIVVSFPYETDIATVQIPEPNIIPLLKKQRAAISEKLQATCFNSGDGEWYFPREKLLVVAKPFDGEDIEDTVEWRPAMAAIMERGPGTNRMVDQIRETDQFLKPLVASGFFRTLEAAEIVWNIFITRMQDRLVNEQMSVHLGFCRLYALPYRANWKQLLFQMDRTRFVRNGRRSPDSPAAMKDRKVPKALIEERFTAWVEEENRIDWTLEVVPTNQWKQLLDTAEEARRKARGKWGYLDGVVDTMKRLLPLSIDVYRSYLERLSKPIVVLGETSNEARGRVRAPDRGRTIAISPPGDEPINTPVPGTTGQSVERVGECPHTGLRTVLHILPEIPDVRIKGGTLVTPNQGRRGTAGVPVPDGQGDEV